MRHRLKTVQPYFQHVLDGDKTFELRENDRGFQKGDELHLVETVNDYSSRETGRSILARVSYVLGGAPWMADRYVALGLTNVTQLKDFYDPGPGSK